MRRSALLSSFSRLLGVGESNDEVYGSIDWALAVRIGGFLWLIGLLTADADETLLAQSAIAITTRGVATGHLPPDA